MIEINFFEKKEPDYPRFILIAIFLVGLLIISAYVLMMSNYYVSKYEKNIEEINQHQSVINEIEHIQELSNTLKERELKRDHLKEHQYPTVFLYNEIVDTLTDFVSLPIRQYNFSINDGVYLNLALEGLSQVAELERRFSNLSFVTSVKLISADLTRENRRVYLVQFQIDIDQTRLSEVMTSD